MRLVTYKDGWTGTLLLLAVCLLLIRLEEWNIYKGATEKKAIPIYNQRLAGFLMMTGFRLMGIEENQRYKGKNVFYFMESDKIRESIQIYLSKTE